MWNERNILLLAQRLNLLYLGDLNVPVCLCDLGCHSGPGVEDTGYGHEITLGLAIASSCLHNVKQLEPTMMIH